MSTHPDSSAPRARHGIWRVLPSIPVSEILARSGFDFQILDREHGGYDYGTLLGDILACERHGCAPWVRVSGADGVEVQRCLDLGARGIVFPQLADPAAFRRAAAMMDHAPGGTRGYNPFVRAYGYGEPANAAPGRPWFVPIVETLTAVKSLEEILRIKRIDCIYVGSYDLSAQLDCAGEMNDPRLQAVVDRILQCCAETGTPVGLMALDQAGAERWLRRGVRVVVHGVESHRMREAFGRLTESAKPIPPRQSLIP